YVIRRAPFRIYEVIQPNGEVPIATQEKYTAWRLAIPYSWLKKAGTYKIIIQINGMPNVQSGTFIAKIYNVKLPQLSKSHFFYTNWFNLPRMEERQKVKRGSNEWYKMLDDYAALMAHGRQNSILVPWQFIRLDKGKIVLDEDMMIKFIEIFRKHGFRYFESPILMYAALPDLKITLTKRPYNSPIAKREVDTIMTLINEFTKKYNLRDAWFQHISDEPTEAQAKSYKEVVSQVRSIYSGIKIMDATHGRQQLVGAIDFWCPHIDDFETNKSFFEQRMKAGEKVLVYTSLGPGGKW